MPDEQRSVELQIDVVVGGGTGSSRASSRSRSGRGLNEFPILWKEAESVRTGVENRLDSLCHDDRFLDRKGVHGWRCPGVGELG